MASQPSDDTRTLFKLLADNEWHRYEDVKDQLARTIPPGRALRKYEERLKSSRKVHDTSNPTPALSEDDQIFYGGRACAQVTISSWREKGLAWKQDDFGVKWIRIKPGFKAFGIAAKGIEEALAQEAPKEPAAPVGTPEVPRADSEPSEASRRPSDGPSGGAEKAGGFRDESGDVIAAPVPEAPTRFIDPEPALQWRRNAEGNWERIVDPTAGRPEPVFHPVGELPEAGDSNSPAASSQSVTVSGLQECSICGALSIDSGFHDQWHKDQNGVLEEIAKKIIDPVTLRTLFSEETGQSLQAFQLGMTQYLEVAFSQLEAQIQVLSKPGVSGPWWAVGKGKGNDR